MATLKLSAERQIQFNKECDEFCRLIKLNKNNSTQLLVAMGTNEGLNLGLSGDFTINEIKTLRSRINKSIDDYLTNGAIHVKVK